jgi:imidazolonepropionase-like amidohydrolase
MRAAAAVAIAVAASLLGAFAPTRAQNIPASPVVAFTGGTVIDVAATATADALRQDHTVVVFEGRIAAVGPAKDTAVPSDALVVDGTGKFLIPGLWDMHTHTLSSPREVLLPVYLANGVTRVRDMGGTRPVAEARELRWELETGARDGPIVVASPLGL